jgi:hypothetical protein
MSCALTLNENEKFAVKGNWSRSNDTQLRFFVSRNSLSNENTSIYKESPYSRPIHTPFLDCRYPEFCANLVALTKWGVELR